MFLWLNWFGTGALGARWELSLGRIALGGLCGVV